MQVVTCDWPSVCGWKAVLISSLVPVRLKNSDQKALVKTGPRSLTMEQGTPCSRTMVSKKALATETTLYGWLSAIKWPYLETIDHGENDQFASWFWESLNKIHGNVCPNRAGKLKCPQQPSRMEMFRFVAQTCALAHKQLVWRAVARRACCKRRWGCCPGEERPQNQQLGRMVHMKRWRLGCRTSGLLFTREQ